MGNADLEYKNILEERVKKLQAQINELKLKEEKRGDIGSHYSATIKGLELEIESLNQKIADYDKRAKLGATAEDSLSYFDAVHEKNSNKQSEIEAEIKALKEQKEKLLTAKAKRIADNKIIRLEKKLEKLKKRGATVGKIQRRIMYPIYLRNLKRENLLSHAQGRVNTYEDKLHDNEEIKKMLDPDKHLFDGLKEAYYDIKGAYYKKRLDRSLEILNEMKKKNTVVTMYGSRVTSLGKKYLDRIRNINNPVINPVAATK